MSPPVSRNGRRGQRSRCAARQGGCRHLERAGHVQGGRAGAIFGSPPARGQAWADSMVAGEAALAARDGTKRRAEAIADPRSAISCPRKVPDNVWFSFGSSQECEMCRSDTRLPSRSGCGCHCGRLGSGRNVRERRRLLLSGHSVALLRAQPAEIRGFLCSSRPRQCRDHRHYPPYPSDQPDD